MKSRSFVPIAIELESAFYVTTGITSYLVKVVIYRKCRVHVRIVTPIHANMSE